MLFDVIVIGGGTAGVIAAVQAGRAGAKTLLIEKNGMLGGTMTVGGVNFPGLFHADSKQIIKGIGWELVEKSVVLSNDKLPDFSTQGSEGMKHWMYQVRINIPCYAYIADVAVSEAGVKLLLHSMLASMEWSESDNCWSVGVCTKSGIENHSAKIVIDCTADANAVEMAGYGIEEDEEKQPATLVTHLSGYEFNSIDKNKILNEIKKALKNGELLSGDSGWSAGFSFIRGYGGNTVHINGKDFSTSEGRTEADVAGRETIFRLIKFYRRQKGLENIKVDYMYCETAVRESRRIIGDKKITVDEYESGAVWDDSISFSYYPIDLHTDSGLVQRELAKGVKPTIPLGAMLPKGATNLIAAGRHICGDKLASSAYRVQASCMAMGQAAGAASALAAGKKCDIRDIPVSRIKDLLAKHNAIVP